MNLRGTWNIDLSLSRIFQCTERWNLEVWGDAFNIVNHGNWILTSRTAQSITSTTFGQITNFGSPRIIQLSMKLNFLRTAGVCPPYSSRRAIAGSIRAACIAGIRQAQPATARMSNGIKMNVKGSFAGTP